MHDHIDANASEFAGIPMPLPSFLALIDGLRSAQQLVTGTRTRGSGEARDSARNTLWTAMEVLLVYVQSLADLLSPEGALALIKRAGLEVAQVAVRPKPVLQAKLTSVKGVVALIANLIALVGRANASKKVTFLWQMSVDGKTWTDLAPTPYAKTTVSGLTLMTTYSFRVSVTVGETPGAWSQAVSLVVY